MIQSIEVVIKSGPVDIINALVLCSKNICYINDKKYKVPNSFIEELKETIYLWKEEYGADENIDSEEFNIIVKSTDGKDKFHGKGIFPHNYDYLKELLGDVHDRTV